MRAHLGGSSRQSLVAARASLDAAVKGVDANAASALSAELFFVADVLDKNIAVRRALTDSSRDASSKNAFIAELFGSKVGAAGITILKEISAMRWSGAKDLVQVIEQLAIEAEASAANIAGELDRVEDEIFTASRAIAGASEFNALRNSDEPAIAREAVKISSSTRSSSPAILAADASASIASCSITCTRSFAPDQRIAEISFRMVMPAAPTLLPKSSAINAFFDEASRDESVNARRTAIFLSSTSATKKSSALKADAALASTPLTAASSDARAATSD